MSKTYWRASRWHDDIEEVAVLRETPAFLVIEHKHWNKKGERRVSKNGTDEAYFPTRHEAWQHLLARATAKRDYHLREAERAEEAVARLFANEPKANCE